MKATEIRTDLHSRINHLSDTQLEELRRYIDERFPEKEKTTQCLKKRPFGLRKGSLKYMADDFANPRRDAPLDDFKDYMPDRHPGE